MPQARHGSIRIILGVVALMVAAGCGSPESPSESARSTARLAETSAPDFVVTQVTAPITAHPGDLIASQVTVCNQGLLSSGTQVALFLSSDPLLTVPTPPYPSTTVLLKSANTGLLQPGQCQTLSLSGLGSGQEDGGYYLGAVVDPDNSQPELNEANNLRSSSRFGIGTLADLVVTKVTGPTSATVGQQLTAQVTVCNRGPGWGDFAQVSVYLSSNPVLTPPVPPQAPTAFFLGTTYLGQSFPAQCQVLAISGPASVDTAGAYFLVGVADPDNTQPELFEDNNALASSPIGVGLMPDFVVAAVTGPPSTRSGPFAASVTVCNQGTLGGSTQVEVHATLDQDASSPVPPLFIGTLSTEFLPPGQCQTQPVGGWLRGPAGAYSLGAVADPDHTTPELIEDNNSKVGSRFGLGLRPDFVVTAVSGPPSAPPGGSITASVTVCNQGTQSGSTSVGVYLSSDELITPPGVTPPPYGPDRLVGTRLTDALGPGQCQTLSVQGSAWGPEGGSYLGAVADPDQSTPELIEDNNARAGNRIGIGLRPDFMVTAVSSPENLLSVGEVDPLVTVCNQGTAGGSTRVNVYTSWDERISLPDPNLAPYGQDWWVGDAYTGYLWPGQCQTLLVYGNVSGVDGVYFLGAVVDPDHTTPELIEDNNSNPGSRMGVGWGPDFVVTQVAGPASVLPDHPLTAQVTVCNRGVAQGSTQVALLLSSDNLIATPVPSLPEVHGLLVGSVTTAWLYEEQCQTVAISGVASVPAEGAYSLAAVANPDPSQQEMRWDNNAKTGSRIGIGEGPDFVVTEVTGPPSTTPGAFTASVTVCNQGTREGSTQVDLYVSPDQELTPLESTEDRLVGSMYGDSLAPGQCQTQSVEGLSWDAEGAFYLGAVALPDLSQPELISDNNTKVGSRIGIGEGPDFVVTEVTGPPSVLQGGPLTASATVCNQGTLAGSTRVGVFVSADTLLSPPVSSLPPEIQDQLLGATSTGQLGPGQCQTVSVSGSASRPTDGAYYLGAVANLDHQPELIDDNDSHTGSRIGIGLRPDFVVTAVTGPASVPPFGQLTGSVTVCNQGTLANSAWVVLYLSADSIIERPKPPLPWELQDLSLGGNYTAVLEPGQCQPLEIQGQLWTETPGGYLGAIVIPDESQPELIEDNNSKAGTPITVTP